MVDAWVCGHQRILIHHPYHNSLINIHQLMPRIASSRPFIPLSFSFFFLFFPI
eukprot:NODE_5357_length_288_cov_35.238494_g5274_i0.p2 GENE.NODE_5357_length_288_cov_35.238494_g5274_i0~~NODE_5357_length_288_cov_35.238494_g5274_i0.p2  ORF type:complete len:53 (-),score=11.91 NODE_5357_length_288_cov_35.238494_g5274_i0:34-192(-)